MARLVENNVSRVRAVASSRGRKLGSKFAFLYARRQLNEESDTIAGIGMSPLPYTLFFVVRQRGVNEPSLNDTWQQCFSVRLGRMPLDTTA